MVPNIVPSDTVTSRFLSLNPLDIYLFVHTMFRRSLQQSSLLIVWGGHYVAEGITPIRTLSTIVPVWSSPIVNAVTVQSILTSNVSVVSSIPILSCYLQPQNICRQTFPNFPEQAFAVLSELPPHMLLLMHPPAQPILRMQPRNPMPMIQRRIPLNRPTPQPLFTLIRIRPRPLHHLP